MGILSLALWAPAVGALIVAFLPRARVALIRAVARFHAALALGLTWGLLWSFDLDRAGPQLEERLGWHAETGMSYALGVDGLSLPLVLLASLIALAALLASEKIEEHVKSYHIWFLLLETATLGVFLARDWTLFYMFWEATLVPVFFLIDRWGGPRRSLASINFVIYTMGGSIFLLLALLMLYGASPLHSFGMDALAGAGALLPRGAQIWLLLAFLVGFGVKMPIVPLHGWLPLAHVEAPTPVSMVLSAVLIKMGGYGLIRACGILPEAAVALGPSLAALAVLCVLYGGLLAWRQRDLKAMIAWSSVSHMGVVLLGVAALNELGLLGAALMMVAHGLTAGALFLLVGGLVSRTHERDLGAYGGLSRITPRFAALTSITLMASLGLPGLASFMAELHAILGAIARWGWPVAAVGLGVLISAAYAVRTIGRLFAGPPQPGMESVSDLSGVELAAALPLVAGIVGLGVAPELALALMRETLAGLSVLFE